jgi:ABC-type polar amino acid transport system ATPase subunit
LKLVLPVTNLASIIAPAPPRDEPLVLEVRDMHKAWPVAHRADSEPVLRGVNMRVAAGDVVALLGPNGCGKSTFLRCLNLLEPYQQGEVRLRGEVVSRGRPINSNLSWAQERAARHLRTRIGMVFQQFNLFPHLSVMENVMIGPHRGLKKSRSESGDIAERMLRKVGLLDKAHAEPMTLSGGQQQRVAIARSLAMNPEVMLFDEVTSALDPVLTREVLRVIRDLAENDRMTMLLVTHDMELARTIADRVIFMHQGRVAVEGSPRFVFDECEDGRLREFIHGAAAGAP